MNKIPIIGRQSLRLIDKLISAKNIGKDDWICPISGTQIARIVEQSADRIGVQEITPKDDGTNLHQVTPHRLREYWKYQMKQAGVEDRMLEYLMDHRPSPYDRVYEEELLLSAYKKAEPMLRVY